MSVIIVEPSSSGVALVEAAHRMGLTVFVFTANQDDRKISAVCRSLATSVIVVDTNNSEAIFAAAQEINLNNDLQAIVPGFEYVVDVVATAAGRLGLPHLSQQTTTSVRNKFANRETLSAAGLDVPRYALVRNQLELERAASEVRFPAVIKPVDGCGSLMVCRVDSLEELQQAVDHFPNTMLDMGKHVGSQFLLEEFLTGPEFSIEGYVDQAQPYVVAITEKQLGAEPFFVEMGHVVEAALPMSERTALIGYIERVVLAIGLEIGVFHAEARMTERGPILIEIAARLGGDRIYRLVELTTGLSLPATMIRSYCGVKNPARIDPLHIQHAVAGVRFMAFETLGRFGAVEGLEQVRTMSGCEEVEIYFNAGDVIPPLIDFRGRVGHVLFTADDRATLDMRLIQAESEIRLAPQAA